MDRESVTASEIISALQKPGAPGYSRKRLIVGDGCWWWTGSRDSRGRGKVWFRGRLTFPHRAIWEYLFGPIPEGKIICHTCDNSGCTNPLHQYVGTDADNVRDMVTRGRAHWQIDMDGWRAACKKRGRVGRVVRGEEDGNSKLTEIAVRAIRADTRPTRFVASDYQVDKATIRRVRNRVLWAHVP